MFALGLGGISGRCDDLNMYQKKGRPNQARDKLVLAEFQKGKTLAEIGKMFGVSRQRIHQIIQDAGIKRIRKHQQISQEVLKDLYLKQKKSITETAKLLGVTLKFVSESLSKYNIPKRSNSEQNKISNPSIYDRNEICHLYVEKNYSRKQLAAYLGCSVNAINKQLHKLKITKGTIKQ